MEQTPNRFDRIVAILIQLQSKKIVKAQDLADRFGVTLRTIYRDIKSLDNAGVPIIGEAGSGYAIMEGYRLPPVMFSREEAGSFVAAEKLMQRFTDEQFSAHFSSALYKVKSVLRNDEKNLVASLEDKIAIKARAGVNKSLPHALQYLVESMTNKKQALLTYKSYDAESATNRAIEPVGIFHENQYWYILAWCHLRNDYRQFRIDRINAITLMEKPFTRSHPTLNELRSKKQDCAVTRVRILVKKSVVPFIRFGSEYHGFLKETSKGDWVELEFDCPNVEMSFIRWFLMFADHARILEPESLKENVRKILQNALTQLD